MTLLCCDWISGFLTASALLAAILLVWARFWVYVPPANSGGSPTGNDEKALTQRTKRAEQFRVSLGRAWVCLAIVSVLIAFALAFRDCSTRGSSHIGPWAVSFGMTAFFMTGYAMLESLSTAVLVLCGKAEHDKPTVRPMKKWQKRAWAGAMLGVVFGLFLVSKGLTGLVPIQCGRLGGALVVIGTAVCVALKLWSLKQEQRERRPHRSPWFDSDAGAF